MLYFAYRIGFYITKHLPLKACYAIAGIAARVFYLFSKRSKSELKENLRVVLGEKTGEKTLDKHAFEVFRNFAKYLTDFFRFCKFTKSYISENVTIRGREYLDQSLSEGKGVILAALHLGNWELGGALVGSLNYPISAIVLEHASKKINDFFVRQRIINGLKSIPIGARIRECFKAIRRNEIVAITGDKDYTSNGVPVTFFGKEAIMPRGPAVLSLRTGAPIIFCGLMRNKDDTYDLFFEKAIKYAPTEDQKKDERILMEKYLGVFEKYIKKYPDQWYVFRRLWPQEQTTQ